MLVLICPLTTTYPSLIANCLPYLGSTLSIISSPAFTQNLGCATTTNIQKQELEQQALQIVCFYFHRKGPEPAHRQEAVSCFTVTFSCIIFLLLVIFSNYHHAPSFQPLCFDVTRFMVWDVVCQLLWCVKSYCWALCIYFWLYDSHQHLGCLAVLPSSFQFPQYMATNISAWALYFWLFAGLVSH